MARDWPARDIAPLIALIDDPRHARRRGRHLPAVRRAGAGHPRAAPAAADRRSAARRSPTSLKELAGEITDYLDILRSRARGSWRSSRTSCAR